MDFTESIKQEIETKYSEMLNNKNNNPYDVSPMIDSYGLFKNSNTNYHSRLNQEKTHLMKH